MPANTAICKAASPAPLRFEEKFRALLNLTDGSPLAKVLSDSRILIEVAGLVQAFLTREPSAEASDVVNVLECQRQRGRKRKQALPPAINALREAARRYRDLLRMDSPAKTGWHFGLESVLSGFAEAMEQEASRLAEQKIAWDEFHNEKRLGVPKPWFFLVTLQDFLKFAADYRVTMSDLVRLLSAGERVLTPSFRVSVPDDVRGLEHFRKNPRNQTLCLQASVYAAQLASRVRPLP